MSKKKPRDLAASVQDRLRKLARERGEEFQLVLMRYGLERLLYRLCQSQHHGAFVLKGAMLFQLWSHHPHRATNDLDLLGKGDNQPERFQEILKDVCRQEVEADGLIFPSDTVQASALREDQEYRGLRIKLIGKLGNMRIPIQIDIGFGDVVTPEATEVEYPTLLDFPAPRMPAYSKETVIAEKFQAMVMLGIANSRMKDFYDLWILARDFAFQGQLVSRAIQATFKRRKTSLPRQIPLALTAEFYEDDDKCKQWQAFISKGKLSDIELGLNQIASVLQGFLLPPVDALANGEPFELAWQPMGSWAPQGKETDQS